MKRNFITSLPGVVLAVVSLMSGAAALPAQRSAQLSAGDFETISFSPVPASRSSRTSGNVVVTLTTSRASRSSRRRPPRLAVTRINGEEVVFKDDGVFPDERAGDGVYSTAARMEANEVPRRKVSRRLGVGGDAPPADPPGFISITCDIEVVDCPPDCESSIFHTPCILCVNVTNCKITFGIAMSTK